MNLRTGWNKEIWKGACNNMASIRERNGKFNVIYSYTNEKGERKQKWETYETKAEAKRRKKEIEYKKEMGSFVVRKWTITWLWQVPLVFLSEMEQSVVL